VIPLRGKSKGIPRKNIRLMNGVPLLVYVIRTAESLREKYFVDIVIDTEDLEICEIAEQYEVEVMNRPEELAGDAITLDPVVYHAVCGYENKKQIRYDVIITMQATSPTLRKETLHRAIKKFLSDDADTMISAVNEPHLSWGYKDGNLVPEYDKRLNRQQLPVHLKETGGFLISKREYVTEKSRIGKKVVVFAVPEKEAIDIDTDFDWILCETILSSKKIILRADGEESLGMGHIYRCMSIAYHLTGHEILFVAKRKCFLGVKKLQESFFPVRLIDYDEEIYSVIEDFCPDIVVNDILDTDKIYMKELKKRVDRVINFEDRGEGAFYADCVINALYLEKGSRNIYNGFKYFFIRDEFLTAVPKKFSEEVKNIVVLFGGSDPSDLTRKTYGIFKQIAIEHSELEFHIITGFGYRYKNEINEDKENRIFVHNDVKRVSKYLAEADMAITSQGRTIYELACMGVPSIVLAQNSRELEHIFANIANGFINLGIGKNQDNETIRSTVEWLLRTPNVRREMHELLLGKDFRQGQKQVIRLILGEKNGRIV
jgi:CMP-N-acetylneuraminic acid synthetase